MLNKDNNKIEFNDRVITPEVVFEAFDNLPFNYLTQTQEVLAQWLATGKIKNPKTFF